MDNVPLDPRRNAFREDLADARLQGQVAATRFVEGRPGQVRVAIAPVFGTPDAGTALTTQLLFGESVRVFEEKDGWAWLQADADGYVGYAPAAAIGVDLPAFLSATQPMVVSCGDEVPPAVNPGVRLGVIIGEAAKAGRNKLTILPSERLKPIGAWLEQLLAESTGKQGKGPVWRERMAELGEQVPRRLREGQVLLARQVDTRAPQLGERLRRDGRGEHRDEREDEGDPVPDRAQHRDRASPVSRSLSGRRASGASRASSRSRRETPCT